MRARRLFLNATDRIQFYCRQIPTRDSEVNMIRSTKRTTVQILKVILGFVLTFLILKVSVALIGDESKQIPISNEFTALMNEAETVNEQRRQTVKAVCKKYNLGLYQTSDGKSAYTQLPAPQYSVFYIDRLHNVSYCPIYKAGSTTWLYNLCLLMNVPEEELNSGKEQISTIARRVIPELDYPEADEGLKATKKLLVVRHPFERLLSAYRDKLENSVAGREHGTLHFYRKYGAEIVRKYRDSNVSAPRANQVIRRKDVPPPSGEEPTWREFVEYLIRTDLPSYADDHWMPYYFYCTPCLVDYDIIAAVETLWRDQVYAIQKLGLESVIKPRWRHSGGQSNASAIYFSQLSKDTVQRLYEKFRLDFELFGYSPNDYYQFATSPN